MLTRTSFNPTLLASIDAAMRAAVGFSNEGGQRYKAMTFVCNRRRQITMWVGYSRGQAGAWEFIDHRQRNITHLVLAALRSAGGTDARV